MAKPLSPPRYGIRPLSSELGRTSAVAAAHTATAAAEQSSSTAAPYIAWRSFCLNEQRSYRTASEAARQQGPEKRVGRGRLSADSLPGLRSDYNILVDRLSSDDGNRFINLNDWQSTTGLDRHSRIATRQDVFANPGSNDYHLRSGSPALGAADPTLVPSYDITASTRPVGAAADIGAFEADDRGGTRETGSRRAIAEGEHLRKHDLGQVACGA
jgi:hypothetical protein